MTFERKERIKMPWGWALGAEEVQRVPVSNGMGGLEGEEKPAKGLGRSAGQRVCPGSQWEGSVPRRRKRSGWHGLRMERSENPAGVGQHGGPGDSSGEARQVWDRARAEVWWGWAIWGDITPGEQSRKRRGGGVGRRASCSGSLQGNHQPGKVGASLPVTAPVQSSPKHFFVLSPRWHMHESSDTLLWVAASSWHEKSPEIGSCWEPRAETLVKQKPPECWQDVLDLQCPPGERPFLALEALPERLSGPGGSGEGTR